MSVALAVCLGLVNLFLNLKSITDSYRVTSSISWYLF